MAAQQAPPHVRFPGTGRSPLPSGSGSGSGMAPGPAPGPGMPGGIPSSQAPTSAIAPKLRAAFAEAARRQGKPHLGWNDPTSLFLWQVFYKLTPEQAQQAAQQVAQQNQRGQPFDDDSLDRIGFGARGGREAQDKYDPAFDVGSSVRQAVTEASKTQSFAGPMDPKLIWIIKNAAKGVGTTLDDYQAHELAKTGVQYHGALGTTVPDDYYDWQAGQLTQRKYLEGHQMNPATWDGLGDTGRALYLSAIGRSGRDQTDWQQRLNASRPVGSAPRTGSVDYAQNLAGVY